MSIQVRCFTEEEWLRMVQHMSRKELIALVIEQQKEKERLVYEKTSCFKMLLVQEGN